MRVNQPNLLKTFIYLFFHNYVTIPLLYTHIFQCEVNGVTTLLGDVPFPR